MQRDIALRVSSWSSAVVSTIDSLEGKRLVRRERSDVDRRQTDVFLTDLGKQRLNEWLPKARKVLKSAFDDFSRDEIVELRSMLARVQVNLTKRYGK
jgi:DNA-binding MarR family transcriptional regulator